MAVINYLELPSSNHWIEHNFKVYTYKDLFCPKDYDNLKKLVKHYYARDSHYSFLIHGAVIKNKDTKVKLVSSNASNRHQEIPFDWSYHKDWPAQNPSTIKKFTQNLLYSGRVDPHFIKFIREIETLPPFSDEPEKWVCYRLHLNMLEKTNALTIHLDGGLNLYNKPVKDVRAWSFTFYLWDHKENEGGEFFTEDGYVYKPQQNTAICLNGHQALHGVTSNMSEDGSPRLGFTTRWLHVDDINFAENENTMIYEYEPFY